MVQFTRRLIESIQALERGSDGAVVFRFSPLQSTRRKLDKPCLEYLESFMTQCDTRHSICPVHLFNRVTATRVLRIDNRGVAFLDWSNRFPVSPSGANVASMFVYERSIPRCLICGGASDLQRGKSQ